ncbi:flagellar hook-basal body protein [Thermoleophilum album]|uniref:flagellar hook-basal body protein n=1 Tax=Thermoleophilum album TaxID=29539 RepID=UPI000CB9FEBC|nr:flagellar hook-basal body protein [Thermoleophilum album]MCL6440802.1 flagellar hook-basal body protein [Thermoleophilum sp.]WDT94548.1 flagellar hook-basal body protein [Thermoleophilum album]GBD46559.1 Flagellar basal-body rod protein FlgG [bacterium HR41]
MERGLYIAASGMLAELVRQNLIANDLANVTTPGYKPDRASQRSFADVLLVNSRSGQAVGPLGLGSVIAQRTTDFSPAPLRDTGEPLDFAIEGEGFFAVRTPQGVRYTRNGQFHRSAQGTLVDALGNAVLDRAGRPITVGADGRVDPRQLATYELAGARKVGDNYVVGRPVGAGASVRAGALEASGTNAARAMVDMIASLRAYEAAQRVITTIDQTLERTATQVAAMPGA